MLLLLAIAALAAFGMIKLIGWRTGTGTWSGLGTTPGSGSRALAIRDSLVSISAGVLAAATMDPDDGATLIAIDDLDQMAHVSAPA